jgi:ABC-type Mn2+/Zn2+ transport system ATPase subunit
MSATRPCLIAIMGCTGAGKSSFIRLVTGANVEVGHTLSSGQYKTHPPRPDSSSITYLTIISNIRNSQP